MGHPTDNTLKKLEFLVLNHNGDGHLLFIIPCNLFLNLDHGNIACGAGLVGSTRIQFQYPLDIAEPDRAETLRVPLNLNSHCSPPLIR
ncbi:hypothetical protein ES703_121119 [subsurface metagenome]